jgi:hypothetical protein
VNATPAPRAPIGFDHERDWSRGGDWCTCGCQWRACPLRQRTSSNSTPEAAPPEYVPTNAPLLGPRLTPTRTGPTVIGRNTAAEPTIRLRLRGNGGRW